MLCLRFPPVRRAEERLPVLVLLQVLAVGEWDGREGGLTPRSRSVGDPADVGGDAPSLAGSKVFAETPADAATLLLHPSPKFGVGSCFVGLVDEFRVHTLA